MNKKIKLLYDATIVCSILKKNTSRSGIFFVAYNVLLELLKRTEYEVFLYSDDIITLREVVEKCPEFSGCKIYKVSILQEWIAVLLNLKNKNKSEKGNPVLRCIYGILASLLKKGYCLTEKCIDLKDVDVYFSPMKAVPSFIAKNKRIKKYTILHDAIPIVNNHRKNAKQGWFYSLIKSINKDDFYFANSEYTKQDFLKHIDSFTPEHITVIPLSTGKPYSRVDDKIDEIKQKYNIPLDKKYIFSLCNLDPRKNLVFSIKNFLSFVEKHELEDLVFVLGGSHFDDFIDKLKQELNDLGDKQDKIIRIGYVDDEDMSTLYSGAEMFLFPSLYEGFGIPVLEAMKCGLPVICSNATSIPEVIGDCGIQIDPLSDEQMVSAMEKMYFDREFRNVCIEKGLERAKLFSWEKCVDIISDEIKATIG